MWRLVVFSFFVASAAGACNLYFNSAQPGIFTRKFGSNRLVLPTQGSYITIDDGIEVTAYCTEGFRSYSYYTTTPEKEIIYTCSGTSLVYRLPGSSTTISANDGGTMACPSVSSYYEATVPSCQYYGLAYGFFIGDSAVILADTCYDLNTMQSKFSHYIAGVRTSVLEAQVGLNPFNVSSNAPDVNFGIVDTSIEETALKAAVKSAIPNYASVVNYVMDGLIPLGTSVGMFNDFTKKFDNTNQIAWWQPLKFGNWKLIQEAISRVSITAIYDVYAGTSNITYFPLSGSCDVTGQLTYKVSQYIRTVPLYVWNYVKPNNSTGEGVVIVGINSPFIESGNKNLILCNDICDNISWLGSANNFLKVPSLGYIFCCKPSDVEGMLDNFPILK